MKIMVKLTAVLMAALMVFDACLPSVAAAGDEAVEVPEDVAGSNLVQRAIRGGMIFVPEGSRDKQLEEAEAEAAEKAAGNDIRPDAEQAEEKKDSEKGKKADGSNRGTPKSGGGT